MILSFSGEIDRARAIYAHCSQICDPRMTNEFWQIWKEFEIRHGNEDTMREMLRIKRSVQAMYNTQVNMMSAQMLSSASAMAGKLFFNLDFIFSYKPIKSLRTEIYMFLFYLYSVCFEIRFLHKARDARL